MLNDPLTILVHSWISQLAVLLFQNIIQQFDIYEGLRYSFNTLFQGIYARISMSAVLKKRIHHFLATALSMILERTVNLSKRYTCSQWIIIQILGGAYLGLHTRWGQLAIWKTVNDSSGLSRLYQVIVTNSNVSQYTLVTILPNITITYVAMLWLKFCIIYEVLCQQN